MSDAWAKTPRREILLTRRDGAEWWDIPWEIHEIVGHLRSEIRKRCKIKADWLLLMSRLARHNLDIATMNDSVWSLSFRIIDGEPVTAMEAVVLEVTDEPLGMGPDATLKWLASVDASTGAIQ